MSSAVPCFLRFLTPWVGNRKLFANKFVQRLESKFSVVATFNDVTNAAPGWKWFLSIVPLTQALYGNPPVEKLDLNQSASLTFTGVVWAYYATLIQPQNAGSRALMLCNLALCSVNGYNVARKLRFEASKKSSA